MLLEPKPKQNRDSYSEIFLSSPLDHYTQLLLRFPFRRTKGSVTEANAASIVTFAGAIHGVAELGEPFADQIREFCVANDLLSPASNPLVHGTHSVSVHA